MTDLSIVIVSFNCRKYLEGCLRSIHASNPKCSSTVYVVDNNSTDGTAELLRETFPHVHLSANPQNRGFAAANNQALRMASSRYVMLLNPDTLVCQGALDTLVDFLDRQHGVWAAGPSILNGDRSPQRTGVRFPSNWNILVETLFLDRLFPRTKLFGGHKELFADYTRPREVDYLQGSCLVVRSAALPEVGLLDERFFMYFEETDWCYRARSAGRSVMFLPAAEVVHFGGGETGHYDEPRLLHYHRSLLLFYRKHYTAQRLFWVKWILFCRSTLRILLWFIKGLLQPQVRRGAASSIKGYAKTFGLLRESE